MFGTAALQMEDGAILTYFYYIYSIAQCDKIISTEGGLSQRVSPRWLPRPALQQREASMDNFLLHLHCAGDFCH